MQISVLILIFVFAFVMQCNNDDIDDYYYFDNDDNDDVLMRMMMKMMLIVILNKIIRLNFLMKSLMMAINTLPGQCKGKTG